MKKNISINISGIIFHIEEDGYENLRKYLDSINKYFSSFEDSSEIMADIESRIAEIFLTKLNEGKQVITNENVTSLITTMGSVSDFKAAEEQSDQPAGEKQQTSNAGDGQKRYTAPKQLQRDQKRKILGGVCSGLGSYLNVDPVWIRLLFAILTIAYGITLIVYIIMWIVVPGSYDLDEPEVTKKMFRDSERKVISGVSGGVASFLGIDIIIVRLLFVALTFLGGFGLLIYIVLWVVLPEARTLTDKMQMQGEAVTLSNIESTIKKNQLQGDATETPTTRILLLPFRFIGAVLNFLGKILVPIAEVLRVAVGIIISLLGLSLVFSLVMLGGVLFGIFSALPVPAWTVGLHDVGLPVEVFSNTFPPFMIVAALLAAFIPCLSILLLGISVIARRVVFGATVGWVLFVVFCASALVTAINIPKIAYAFKEEGEFRIEKIYQLSGKKLYLHVNQVGMDDYHEIHLELKGYEGKDLKLVQNFQAQGSTRQNAIENAQMVEYHVDVNDSIITFDSNVKFKKDAQFRAQRLHMILYIPYGAPFVMDNDASRFISHYVDREDADGNTWKMSAKGLECITCSPRNRTEHSDLTDFDEIHVNGMVHATIEQGDDYSVEVVGPEKEKRRYDIHQDGNVLYIELVHNNDDRFWRKGFNWKELKVNITMPDLSRLEAKGAGDVNLINFETDELTIEVLGAIKIHGECRTNNLNATVSGASEMNIRGSSHSMNCTILGASTLKANDFEVEDATVSAHGASHAKVYVTHALEMTEGMASKIDYRGNPEIVKKD